MPEISRQQKQYLDGRKKENTLSWLHGHFFLFCLWDFGKYPLILDGSIPLSSAVLPDRKDLSFHVQDQSLFAHIAVTLAETSCQFLFVVILGVGTAVLLWLLPTDRMDPGAMSGGTEQSPEICSGPLLIVAILVPTNVTIVVAGMSVAIFGSVINLYSGFCQADRKS